MLHAYRDKLELKLKLSWLPKLFHRSQSRYDDDDDDDGEWCQHWKYPAMFTLLCSKEP